MNLKLKNLATINLAWKSFLLLALCFTILTSCRTLHTYRRPYIEFTKVPPADEGGPDKLDLIEGRVIGDHHSLQIVLFARSGDWYVQPFDTLPFTQIQSDSNWKSTTHLGTEYAALLVESDYQPPSLTDTLPGQGDGVIAVAFVKGVPVFWRRWWFVLLCVLASLSAVLAFYNYRLHQSSRQLHLRFEERLAERIHIAQELHDTLLQGVISASMQLHVTVDALPEDLPAKSSLTRVLHIMGQVVEEGRGALKRLRSSDGGNPLDLQQAFSRMRQELAAGQEIDFRITVEGRPRPVHPIIRDEVYRIGREALLNAFRRSRAQRVAVTVIYRAIHLRVVISDQGGRIDSQAPQPERQGDEALSSMHERAERIGARLKVRRLAPAGTLVELSVPGHIAFQGQPSKNPLRWFTVWMRDTASRGLQKQRREKSK